MSRHVPKVILDKEAVDEMTYNTKNRRNRSYSTVRTSVKNLGAKLNVARSPHDLRRYSATYASRDGAPLEIVSKVILRHQDLTTTQIYLGKVSEQEAIRWMDILRGK